MGFPSVAITLCVALSVSALDINFLDCAVKKNSWSFWRQCCKSDQLPNGCECFDIWSSDFTNSVYHLPLCPKRLEVIFFLFDRDNMREPVEIRNQQVNILGSPFNGTRRTVFISHGFNDRADSPWAIKMKNTLLKAEDLNVILVAWDKAAKGANYLQVVANTRAVGAMLGRLIEDLHKFANAPLESFHLVGHSLGAHVSGYAGKEIERLTGEKLGRITGLDPAGPAFGKYPPTVRLDKSDANFVDVIHTDSEPLYSSGFGIRISIGHVDFWPNGGEHQPGCPEETWGIFSLLNFEAEISTGACSHSRALSLFTDSITLCRYDPQGPCTMGYHTTSTCHGDYRPDTLAEEPFC
ncbi:hypothetical protein RRG08_013371 [Elysia crispata]|uniref:Lipase domain-containing protein n=1 Tax=Elysia crispata TaxID=231223 RepID=A0AAE0YRL2_9GAST|nr:hypothetical protein RRG08_013371 [Elysia crispata]